MLFKVKKLGQHWWILTDDGFVGPYNSRGEAEEDKRGLMRTDKHKDDHGFFTSCGKLDD